MSLEGFIYAYFIIEKKPDEDDVIARYDSNAAPPAVGTTMRLREWIGANEALKFEVLAVDMFPQYFSNDERGTSSQTLVEVLVKKTTLEP